MRRHHSKVKDRSFTSSPRHLTTPHPIPSTTGHLPRRFAFVLDAQPTLFKHPRRRGGGEEKNKKSIRVSPVPPAIVPIILGWQVSQCGQRRVGEDSEKGGGGRQQAKREEKPRTRHQSVIETLAMKSCFSFPPLPSPSLPPVSQSVMRRHLFVLMTFSIFFQVAC